MKKTLAILSVLLCFIFTTSVKNPNPNLTPKSTKKSKKTEFLCNSSTLVLPGVTVTYSPGYAIVTLSGGSADGYTVGGYYSNYFVCGTFWYCPVGGSIWIPDCSSGTFRVTAWCGSCQNATASIVSMPYTFL